MHLKDNSANFKYANDFNVFVLGNATQYNIECEGRVAIANNANLVNYSVGTNLSFSASRADLIIGGKVNIDGGINSNGNTIVKDSRNVIKYTMINSNNIFSDPIVDDTINFEDAINYLQNASRFWASLDDNGSINLNNNILTLSGEDIYLNIFTIDGSNINNSNISFENLEVIDIVAPKTSTILINVLGEHISFGNFFTLRNSIPPTPEEMSLIVLNFPQSKSLYSAEMSIKGSLLAPFSTGNLYDGYISGNLILNNFEGNVKPKNILFKGNLPEVNSENKNLLTISNFFPSSFNTSKSLGCIYGKINLSTKNNNCLRCSSINASNIKIELFNLNNLVLPIKHTYTDYDGNYEFKNLKEGYYFLRIISPEGYHLSDGYCNNDFSPRTGFSKQIFIDNVPYNLSACISPENTALTKPKDCNYFISGIIFKSSVNTSLYNYSSRGINNVFITLYDNYNTPIASTYSSYFDGVDGYYKFENLQSGVYYLKFNPPKYYSFVTPLYSDYYGSKADRDTGTIRVNLEYKDIPHAYVGLNIKY